MEATECLQPAGRLAAALVTVTTGKLLGPPVWIKNLPPATCPEASHLSWKKKKKEGEIFGGL